MHPCRSSLVATLTAMAAVASGGLAATAAAGANPPDPVTGHPYRHGAVPEHVRGQRGAAPLPFNPGNADATTRSRHTRHGATSGSSPSNLNYGGGVGGIGVTTGTPTVYVVFWGSQWGNASTDAQGNTTLSGDPQAMAPRLQGFLRGLGTNGELWSGVLTQYCEGIAAASQTCPSGAAHVGAPSASGVLAGVWEDTATAAPSAASGKDLANEALRAESHFGQTAASSRSAQYVVVSPTGTNPDNWRSPLAGYCAWHDYTGDSSLSGSGSVTPVANSVAFTNLPYLPDVGANCGANFVNSGSAGTLDGVSIVEGHEYGETLTDQFPAGGWTDSSGNENGDKCAWIAPGTAGGTFDLALATGTFAMQTTWSNDDNSGTGGCQGSHPYVGGSTSSGNVAFKGLPTSLSAGSSASGTVELDNSSGAPQAATSPLTVSLSSTGGGSFTQGSQVTIPAGSSSAPVTFTDTRAESATVTASAPNYTTATQTESVTAGPASALSVSPSSATIGTGAIQTLTANLTDQWGNAVNAAGTAWSVSSGGTVSPTSGTSTNFSAAATGTYSVTAKNGSLVATASVTVTSGPITNGGFESGSLTGWTSGGMNPAPQVVGGVAHSGTYAALLGYRGASGEPLGDSTIAQTFTVPAAGGTLSFWTWRYTTDTIRYDWQTCQLRNTAGTALTTIFKTASNARSWQQVSVSLASYAKQQVVVWCDVHEDGYGDPTYMYVDDFTVK